MEDTIMTMPVIALRGLTVLPHMTVSFDISRPKSISAVEKAMVGDQKICLVTQRDPEDQDPTLEQLYHIGTIALIKQLVKMPGGIVRVMVDGQEKVELLSLDQTEPMLVGEIMEVEPEEEPEYVVEQAMLRVLKEKTEAYSHQHAKFAKEILPGLLAMKDLEPLMTRLASELPWEYVVRQEYLEAMNAEGRYGVLVKNLANEVEIAEIRREFQQKVKESIDKNQKDYILREQMKIIREELGEDPISDADEYEKQIKALKASKEVKEKLKKELDRFRNMPGGSQEANVLRTYVETLLELPWNKMSRDNNDIHHAEEILNADHYGLEKVKERILEYLAVRMLTKKGSSPIICLVLHDALPIYHLSCRPARNRKDFDCPLGCACAEQEICAHQSRRCPR